MNADQPRLPSKARFSPRGVAFVLAGSNLLLLPVHFFVSCRESAAVGFAGMLLCGIAIVVSLVAPGGTAGRFNPAALAVVACFLNLLAVH